jgi:hypothetical protein
MTCVDCGKPLDPICILSYANGETKNGNKSGEAAGGKR